MIWRVTQVLLIIFKSFLQIKKKSLIGISENFQMVALQNTKNLRLL